MQFVSFDSLGLLFENQIDNLQISQFERSFVQLIASCKLALSSLWSVWKYLFQVQPIDYST